jgi:hypothetical protein
METMKPLGQDKRDQLPIRLTTMVAALLPTVSVLGACSGGGDSGSNTTAPPQLSGTVATGTVKNKSLEWFVLLIPRQVARGVAVTAWALLAGCAPSRYVVVPEGTEPLSQEQVTTLLSNASVRAYINGFDATMTTRSDGSVQYAIQPGKEHDAPQAVVWHAQGNWQVEPTGRFCVSLSWGSATSSHWCRYIFSTPSGYGASSRQGATELENWSISRN